jgi:class 3 adenylate cyclase
MPTPAEQIAQLESAIAGLETQRPLLGDMVVELALTPLKAQLAELNRVQLPAAPPPTAGPSFEGERKQVTIMFADISGFTAMSEKMDPEQVRSMMNACFDHLVPAIRDYDGTVDKFIGDEIMALFGAPRAHENDPERALRAALEMMKRLDDFNHKNKTELGLHFGINTGTVIAGGIGSQQQQQYSVMGDAVNLASRLEDASDRGQIFVGPDTYRLTSPLFNFEELPPVRVKGKSEPIPVYSLLSAKAQPGKVRGLAGIESPMVGRDSELAALLKATSETGTDTGRVAAIIGEPGLGKSRLIAEWKMSATGPAAGRPIFWAEGRCLSYGQGLAYHLLIDLLHSIIDVPPASAEEEINSGLRRVTDDLFGEAALDVYPYLGHLLSLQLEGAAQERVKMLDPQALQMQYLAALRRLLHTLAARQPLILIFDDTHWADPSSTDLLVKLMTLINESPILFCFVTRPDQDVPGWKLVTTARETHANQLVELALQPLTDADSRQLVSNLLEIEALPEKIRGIILQKAEGNPFFVEEVIRMLIDRGAIVKDGNRWAAGKELETIEIPDNLQGLLLARIDRLPEDVKRTLRVASVIGRQFSVRVLEHVLAR